MKIRSGFISNSSSSSFLFALPKNILTIEEMMGFFQIDKFFYNKEAIVKSIYARKREAIPEEIESYFKREPEYACLYGIGYCPSMDKYMTEHSNDSLFFIDFRDTGDGGTVFDTRMESSCVWQEQVDALRVRY